MKKNILFLLIIITYSTIYAQKRSPWKRVGQGEIADFARIDAKSKSERQLFFQLDEAILRQSLVAAGSKTAKKAGTEITIPNINGTLEKFLVWESSNFEPGLQAKYPNIRAYAGIGITDSRATLNFSLSPNGIQTMILRADSDSEFIEPSSGDKKIYVLFNSKGRSTGDLPFRCKTEDVALGKQLRNKTGKISANNKVFKTLRLALSCTGEYTTFHGGTVEGALAGMNATMSRVNGVYNRDLAVKLEIIANNNLIIYTDAAADPYSDAAAGSNGAWNLEVQNNLTAVIGNGGYDIGHLFGASGGGGNAGCIGCVCVDPSAVDAYGKGSGFTSPSDGKPQGDTFDIDFVAHEMGHQLGANHSYSFDIEGTGVSVEPGSGSTIMGYAGITDYDVQSHSDDYFAYVSILQIQENLSTKTCPVSVSIANSPPVVSAGADYTIPNGTAFILKGTGTDPDGDAISYCWEQNDSASTTSSGRSVASPTKADGPLFRSIKPSEFSFRYMPSQANVLLDKLTTTWESVSTVARTLHFTLTARDNGAQGTGQTNSDEMIVDVSGTVGPFAITSQNTEDLSWLQGANQTITWSVNGADGLAGSANVNIKLSTDGGLTFPTVLTTNTPNDGSEAIIVPDIAATNCRLLIEPTANIYYAVNSKPFAIGYVVTSTCDTYTFDAPFDIPESSSYTTRTINVPASTAIIADVNVSIGLRHELVSDLDIEVVNPQGISVKLFDRNCGDTANSNLLLDYDDLGGALSCSAVNAQTVMPAMPLSVFNGQNPQGIWTLKVRDAYAGDVGTLNAASIIICTKKFALPFGNDIDDFALFPNPSNGLFNVKFLSQSADGARVFVYDLSGRKIYENQFDNNLNFDENIRLENVKPGLYLLKVTDGDKEKTRKLLIQ